MISLTKKRAGLSVNWSLSKNGGESGSKSFILFNRMSTPNLLSAERGKISAFGSRECHFSTNEPRVFWSDMSILLISRMMGISRCCTFSKNSMFFSGFSITSVTYNNMSASVSADSENANILSCKR